MAEQQWSQRGYESAEIAFNYINYRPRPPPQLVERIVEFLKEKVCIATWENKARTKVKWLMNILLI